MREFERVNKILQKVWTKPTRSEILSKKIEVLKYEKLKESIPDKFLKIEEIFPESEIEDIWNNFKPYLEEYKIYPFMRTLDESVISIGYSEDNLGKIYYFNFDFGCIYLDMNLDTFISKLV